MKKILVVDDNDLNCLMVKNAIQQEYEVFIVNSGEEAISFLEQELVDLILMDIEMPNMNGIETVEIIKQNERLSKIPIIFLTADSDPETEAGCLACGGDDFIRKPFVPVVMKNRINRIIEVYELRKDLEIQLEKRTHQMEKATKKSLTDGLTGLHNRAYLESNIHDLLAKGTKGAFFMIDLDNFKKMNDEHGHILGDKTLQFFAETLKEYSTEKDIVCRLAGDEFVSFYPELTDKDIISKKAEGIIKTFCNKMEDFQYGGIVSVSIGIIVTDGTDDYTSLYNKGDKSLYYVKNNGKNAYHFYGEHNEKIKQVSTIVDLEYINKIMQKDFSEQKGMFNLAYDEFKKIYNFISRNVERKEQKAQMLLFTIDVINTSLTVEVESIMEQWEKSLATSLRTVDTGTRYSSSQYMMILLDTDLENGKMVANRVIDNFFRENAILVNDIEIRYDIQTI